MTTEVCVASGSPRASSGPDLIVHACIYFAARSLSLEHQNMLQVMFLFAPLICQSMHCHYLFYWRTLLEIIISSSRGSTSISWRW